MGPEDIMRMLMSGGQPDPERLHRERVAALKATTVGDDDVITRILGVVTNGQDWADWAQALVGTDPNREVTLTLSLDEFVALANLVGSGSTNAINGLLEAGQFIQASGVPAEAALDVDDMRLKIGLLLDVWSKVAAARADLDTDRSPVPDDASALTQG